jgi:peptidoglycan/xylan/chitin deacetylase (PgdA/CDA1 family)
MHDFTPQDLLTNSRAGTEYNETSTCLILQYHRVASLCFDPLQLAVEPYHFEQQMEYLAQNFNVVSMDEMKCHLETSQPFRQRTVAVTFDGGYSDVLYTVKKNCCNNI